MSNTQRQQFDNGTHIRLSVEGKSRYPKMSGMRGVVVGGSHDANCVAALWDGRKSRQVLHTSFIEPETPGRQS
jgi:hypothetical protein